MRCQDFRGRSTDDEQTHLHATGLPDDVSDEELTGGSDSVRELFRGGPPIVPFPSQDRVRPGSNLRSNVVPRLDLAVKISRGMKCLPADIDVRKARGAAPTIESQAIHTTRHDSPGIESVQEECSRQIESKTSEHNGRNGEPNAAPRFVSCLDCLVDFRFKSDLTLRLSPVTPLPRRGHFGLAVPPCPQLTG